MKRKTPKIALPPYVTVKKKTGYWYVRRNFATDQRDDKNRIVYVQIVRACDPRTPERAKVVSDIIEAEHLGSKVDAEHQSFKDFVERFVEAKKPAVAENTYTLYRWLYDTFIAKARFANSRTEEITPVHLQRYYAELQDKGTSASMIRKLHVLLSMSFNQGVKWGLNVLNPCKGVILPRVTAPDMDFMDEHEAMRFMKICCEKYPVLALALETGMRPGEYLALRWSDIQGRNLTVTRSVSFPKSGGYVFKETKTRESRRTIRISPQMVETLARQRTMLDDLMVTLRRTTCEPMLLQHKRAKGSNYERRRTRRKQAREVLRNMEKLDLVFPSSTGTPIAVHNLNLRIMKDACRKAKLRHQHSAYSLRHTMAALSLLAGVDVKTLSEKLGHSSVKTTLDLYAYVLPSMREDAMEKLASVLY